MASWRSFPSYQFTGANVVARKLKSAVRVLDVGFGAIAPAGGFAVPAPVCVLPLDRLGLAGHALLRGGGLGGGEGCRMARKRLRENVVDLVGPAAVVFDDLIGDVGHAPSCEFESSRRR